MGKGVHTNSSDKDCVFFSMNMIYTIKNEKYYEK